MVQTLKRDEQKYNNNIDTRFILIYTDLYALKAQPVVPSTYIGRFREPSLPPVLIKVRVVGLDLHL